MTPPDTASRTAPSTDWQMDPTAREIRRGGRRIRLAEKPFLVLSALVEARGGVVTRDALRRTLWSDDTFVDFDNNLNSAVATLRHALGDSARAPVHIETIPKVGYRLLTAPGRDVPGTREVRAVEVPRTRAVPAAIAGLLALSAVAALLAVRAWPGAATARTSGLTATDNADARASFQRGLYLRGRQAGSPDPAALLSRALDAFGEAARLDPAFAAAVAEQADTLVEMSFAGAIGFRDGLTRARDAARHALVLDPASPVGARVMGTTTLFLDWNFEDARIWLDRADVAGAAGADAKTTLARAMWLAAAGEADAAVIAAERAVAIDPAAWYVRADLAMFYLVAGRNADAAASAARVLEVAPDFVPARAYALLAHERLGQWTAAAADARVLMRASGAPSTDESRLTSTSAVDPRGAVALWHRWDLARLERQAAGRPGDYALQLALKHALLGDRDAAIARLDEALSRQNRLLVFLRAYPELAILRGDPAFEAIARRIDTRGPA
ncbi:MAG: helix-turn-helix domain-containing protein [Vicinamibacterales bacterium]